MEARSSRSRSRSARPFSPPSDRKARGPSLPEAILDRTGSGEDLGARRQEHGQTLAGPKTAIIATRNSYSGGESLPLRDDSIAPLHSQRSGNRTNSWGLTAQSPTPWERHPG